MQTSDSTPRRTGHSFICSSGGQTVDQATPYLYAACAATAQRDHVQDVSFNAFAGSDNVIVFLRYDEDIRRVEIDKHLLSIESKKWTPPSHHKLTKQS
ncbi:BQ2448_3384 [Microbotryum intermedium]|uniref:BQ2448_3384 protein n=1 Tax=Microbotryum intermedium TaxID=269621 RepID=A0A238F9S4_9BASI|nr:BQ2448_3384 [Microbotryum intermedium]